MAGVRNKPLSSGKYQGWFYRHDGERKFFTGTQSKRETRRMAEKLEDEHRQIRMGYRPAPTAADRNRNRPYSEVRDEYLEWGRAQGGRGGRPWSDVHARMRQARLEWWGDTLDFRILADLDGCLPRMEAALRDLQADHATKTVKHYAEALRAFCNWAVERGYLDTNPLQQMGTIDGTPEKRRRALTDKEAKALIDAAPPGRALLYETALLTGLRANELRSLVVRDMNLDLQGLHLHAEWTKNRKDGLQPAPADLLERLATWVEGDAPDDPLLPVPTHTYRAFDKDRKAAGIPKTTPDGKIDFHALRTTYVTRVVESGATAKEAQELARHASPEITMNTYARTRRDNLRTAVDRLSYSRRRKGAKRRQTCT